MGSANTCHQEAKDQITQIQCICTPDPDIMEHVYHISPIQCGRPLRCDYEDYSSPRNRSNYHTGQSH